jgi:hypothetical protein
MLPLFVSGPRQHVPLLAIGTLLASSLVLRCASMDDSGGRLSQTDAAVTGEGGTGGVQIFVETGGSPSAPVDAGPTYACRPATVEKDCPSPDVRRRPMPVEAPDPNVRRNVHARRL